MFSRASPERRYSHEIPVQLVRRHLLQQRLQAALEEDLEAEVVLDDQGGRQAAIYDLNTRTREHADVILMHYIDAAVFHHSR